MKIVILDGNTVGENMDFSPIEKLGEVTHYDFTDSKNLKDRIKDAEVIITNKQRLNEASLKDAKNLKLIAVTATGTNNIDFDYVRENGIAVANVSGYSTDSVAQHTFALLFYLYEKLAYFDDYVKSGGYSNDILFTHYGRTFHELSGKTYGIIGLGNIGKKVAKIADAFGARVIYYSTSGRNNSSEYERVDFDTLLKTSDIISVHAPLNKETYHLLNKEAFKKMKNTAILINVGRGPIIVEDDLYEALINDEIAAAGLDVLRHEPINADNKLLLIKDSEKLLITPHIAWASIEARKRVIEETALNIEAFIKGEKRNRVD